MFNLSVNSNTGTSGESCIARLYKNGSLYRTGQYISAGTSTVFTSNLTALVAMNGTTDYIEGWVYVPATITVLVGSSVTTYLSGCRVGA